MRMRTHAHMRALRLTSFASPSMMIYILLGKLLGWIMTAPACCVERQGALASVTNGPHLST